MFVCLGNICRSPAAEIITRKYVRNADLENQVECTSSGLGDYHVGGPADSRMIAHAIKRGYHIDTIAQQFNANQDGKNFDLIISMDNSVNRSIQHQLGNSEKTQKVKLFTMFCKNWEGSAGVPDPYYGGNSGFDNVLDILEDGCGGLLEHIKENLE